MGIEYTEEILVISRNSIFEFPLLIPSYTKIQISFENISYLKLFRKLEYKILKGRRVPYEKAREYVITDSLGIQRYVGDIEGCRRFVAEYQDLLFSCND